MVCQVHVVVECQHRPLLPQYTVCSTLFASLKGIIRIVIKGNKPVVGLEYSSKKNECGIHIIKG